MRATPSPMAQVLCPLRDTRHVGGCKLFRTWHVVNSHLRVRAGHLTVPRRALILLPGKLASHGLGNLARYRPPLAHGPGLGNTDSRLSTLARCAAASTGKLGKIGHDGYQPATGCSALLATPAACLPNATPHGGNRLHDIPRATAFTASGLHTSRPVLVAGHLKLNYPHRIPTAYLSTSRDGCRSVTKR